MSMHTLRSTDTDEFVRVQDAIPNGFAYRYTKRLLDLAVSIAVLFITGPLILLAAAAVKFFSPGPAFIRVPRIGLGGRPISILKIRTMHVDAERLLERHLAEDPEAAREWRRTFKLRADPRVVPYVGTFLRKSSIDELPQFVDVIRGAMSVVGPRPFPEYHLAAFDPAFRAFRLSVPPGLTGLWQIECRNNGNVTDQIYWDTRYIRSRSLWLDLSIILRTPVRVVAGPSAF